MQIDLTNTTEIQLHLLTTAYFYGDFSIIHYFTNRNSPICRAATERDIHALKKFALKHEIDLDQLPDGDREKFNQFQQKITNEYKSQLESEPLPLPEQYLEELANRAIQLKNFTSAHSTLQVNNKLDKKVNKFIVTGVQLLQSKDVKTASSASAEEIFSKNIQQAVWQFYQAIRIKNPLGNQFQYLAPDLHFTNADAMRKYAKYVELNLLKELIEFNIHFLVDDKSIAEKICNNLVSAKVRKTFLRYLAEQFSFGKENFQQFVSRYKEAVQSLNAAKEDKEFLKIQKILLGHGTGDNEYYQFFRELTTEHPISALLVSVLPTPGDGIPFIAPIVLKSGISLMEFLELDK